MTVGRCRRREGSWWWAAAALAAVAAAPHVAHGTGSIHCHALDGAAARVSLTLAPPPVPAVLFVRLEADQRRWSTVPEEAAEPIGLAQAFVTDDEIAVDLVDAQAMQLIASVRVLRVEESRRLYQYGYLHVHGVGVHPVGCEGP